MATSYFFWNGTDSRTKGIVVTETAPMVMPTERVEQITVLGRPGVILRTEGDGVYDAYVKTLGIANLTGQSFRDVSAWLRGSGTLVLSTEPNFAYDARVVSECQVESLYRGVWSGHVSFLVAALKSAYPPDQPRLLGDEPDSSANVVHQGDVPARPVYTLEGTGVLELTVGDTEDGGTGSLITVDVGEGDGCVIDTDAGTVTNLEGTESLTASTQLYYNGFRGLWLPVGATTTVAWGENVNRATMDPRWRWL